MIAQPAAAGERDAALALLASLVLEDGRRWGEAAADWQWADAEAILDPASTVPYAFLTRPRGASKTSDLAGVCVAAMLAQAPTGAKLYALAADRDQGRLLVDAIEGYVRRTPALRGALDVAAFKVSIPGSGVVLDVLAADAAGAWGLRPYFVVVDELAQWAETSRSAQLFEAVRSAVGKVNGRLVILTTAGDPSHFAFAVREHARKDPLWRLHEVPGPVPWLAPERIEEQRRALPESSFRRLHLNEWVEADDRLALLDDLLACVRHVGRLEPVYGLDYVVGVDLGVVHDRAAAAVCHLEPRDPGGPEVSDWCTIVDVVETWQGNRAQPVSLAEIREWLFDTTRRYRGARVVIDPWQANLLTQELRQRGVRVREFPMTSASIGELAARLHVAIRNHTIALPDDDNLVDELKRIRLRETSPGVLRLDHDHGQHDDRAIAVALALTELLERPPNSGPRIRVLG